ncbi:hypothetical protein [Viridibacillus arvi]|uniref:hypothetical protein n=1 Tax=Viridibacillus arvi TaxID=263475 RepID=UPI0034CF9673
MDAFIGLIGFFGIIAGIVLLIVGFKKKKNLKGGIVLGVSFVLFVIALAMPTDTNTADGEKTPVTKEVTDAEKAEREAKAAEEKKAKEEKEANKKAVAEAKAKKDAAEKKKAEAKMSPEDKRKQKIVALKNDITNIIEDEIGDKNNMDKKRIVKISTVQSATSKSEMVTLKLNASENFTNKMTKGGMGMDAEKILEPISKLDDVEVVTINWLFPLVDAYGNEKDGDIMRIELSKKTLSKINWKNFDYRNFESIADSYWEHPALSK